MQHIIKVTTYTMQVVLDGWGQFHVNYVPVCTQKMILDHFVSDIMSFKRCIRMQRNELAMKRKIKGVGKGILYPSAPRFDRLQRSDST